MQSIRNIEKLTRINFRNSINCTKISSVVTSIAAIRGYSSNESPKYSYEITKDPEEWKFVERLLPPKFVPSPPNNLSYPTPSGWVPPDSEKTANLPYRIERTKNHMLPVYVDETEANTRKFTRIKNIQGDIWALDKDLKQHLETLYPQRAPVLSQVHEPGRWLRIRGTFTDDIAQYLVNKGF